jgi:hypothetical protein
MTKYNGTATNKCYRTKSDLVRPTIYQIRIENHLSDEWTDWFAGMAITLEENGDTLITGPIADQAALFGLLKKVRDLGMPLVSVNRVEPCPELSQESGKSVIQKGEMK